MRYTIEKHEKYSLISLEEEKLDTTIAPKLKSEFITLFQSGTISLILNLSKVKYVDSSGLSAILVAKRLSGEVSGQLVLVGVSDHVMKLITISKLDNVLQIVPTIKVAVDMAMLSEVEKDFKTEEE